MERPPCPRCGETQYVVCTSRVEVNQRVTTRRWACYACELPFDPDSTKSKRRKRWVRRTVAAAVALATPILIWRGKRR